MQTPDARHATHNGAHESDVTLGEVWRGLDSIRRDLAAFTASAVRRDDLASVANAWGQLLDAHENSAALEHERLRDKAAALELRIATLETWQTWTMRTIIGLVIAAGMSLILVSAR